VRCAKDGCHARSSRGNHLVMGKLFWLIHDFGDFSVIKTCRVLKTRPVLVPKETIIAKIMDEPLFFAPFFIYQF
jgi:hypothetical protein